MSEYVCHFYVQGKLRSVELPRSVSDIGWSNGGFWVNENYQWCMASEIKFWIPLSRVEYIEKINGQ